MCTEVENITCTEVCSCKYNVILYIKLVETSVPDECCSVFNCTPLCESCSGVLCTCMIVQSLMAIASDGHPDS